VQIVDICWAPIYHLLGKVITATVGFVYITPGVFGVGQAIGGHRRASRVRRGLVFAKRGPISGDFRPFSTVFRQNDGQNYFFFANGPDIGANVSGNGKVRPVKFSILVTPQVQI